MACKGGGGRDPEDEWQMESDRVTSVAEFNAHKVALCSVLRKKTDRHPFLVKPGPSLDESACMATGKRLRALKDAGEAAELLRGYRLVTVPAIGRYLTFNAVPAVVIRRADGQHETMHSNGVRGCNKPFVFVVSSRMHAGLSDVELCSGRHLLCTVVVGSFDAINSLRMMKNVLSHFQQRKICFTPEEGATRRLLVARPLPFFDLWYEHACDVCPSVRIDLHVAFGFSFREATDEEHARVMDDSVPYSERMVSTEGYALADLTSPSEPWRAEPRVWLPSVQKLHDLYKFHTDNYEKVPDGRTLGVFVELYQQLLNEYWARLSNNDAGASAIPGRSASIAPAAFR